MIWSICTFTTVLLHFQLKYLEGSIFMNANYYAVSEILAIIFGGFIFYFMGGLKPSYILAFSISIVGALGILYRQNNPEESQMHLLPKEERELEFYRKMPALIFIAKFGIAMSFIAS